MAQGNKGVSRVLLKLKDSIEQGRYYEAHQMYRTLYFRYYGQKKFSEVLQMLFEGASVLLKHDQQESGADLSMLMLDVLEKTNSVPVDQNIRRISKLFELLSPSTPERQQYLVRALKWSSGELYTLGHPELHQNVAQILWNEKDYPSARYHYIRSCDGAGCGSMLIELHLSKGYASEVDMFLAQAVLQYLCLQKKIEASDVFRTYTNKHPVIKEQKGPPFLLPLLNFLWLLLSAVESGKVAQFTVLCEQYQPTLKRDPMYVEYLDKIGQLFFNLPPPRKQQTSGGIFGNLLQGLLWTGDEEPEEVVGQSSSARSVKPDEQLD